MLTMIFVVILSIFFNLLVALPAQELRRRNGIAVPLKNNPNTVDLGVIDPSLPYSYRSVITAPPNCRPGQEWINGACRDVWRHSVPTTPLPKQFDFSDPSLPYSYRSVITAPPNCQPGQEWINGACRDVWRHSVPTTPLPKKS